MSYTRNPYIDAFITALGEDPRDTYTTTRYLHGRPYDDQGKNVTGHQIYMEWTVAINGSMESFGVKPSDAAMKSISATPMGRTTAKNLLKEILTRYDRKHHAAAYTEMR